MDYPELSHGDEFPDADALISGENFVKFGFWNLKGLPVHEPSFGKPGLAYTHYPPFSNWFNAFLRIIFDTDSIQVFRASSLFLSGLAVVVFFLSLNLILKSSWLACVASLFYVVNPWTIASMDALHNQVYSDTVRNGILLTGALLYVGKISSVRFYTISAMLGFILGWIGFEANLYCAFMLAALGWVATQNKKTFMIGGLIVFLSEAMSFLLHFVRNSWYFGSFSEAFKDIFNTASLRAFDPNGELGRPFSVSDWLVAIPYGFTESVSALPFLILVVLSVWIAIAYMCLEEPDRRTALSSFKIVTIFLISAYTWYVPMASHTLEHSGLPLLQRHLVPFIALLAAVACFVFNQLADKKSNNYFWRSICYIPVACIVFYWLGKSELPINSRVIAAEKEFENVAKNLKALKLEIPEGEQFGTNFVRHRFIQYYTNRRAKTILNESELNSSNDIKYFAFVPIQHPNSAALLQELNQSYILIKESPSSRFPVYWFRKK
jgi:hypothetical protein